MLVDALQLLTKKANPIVSLKHTYSLSHRKKTLARHSFVILMYNNNRQQWTPLRMLIQRNFVQQSTYAIPIFGIPHV